MTATTLSAGNSSGGKSSAGKSERVGRLSADDWAQAAIDLIAEQGVSAVAVEPLARRLGVTKGSFYWHFPSRDALLVAALERWEKMEQETVFGQLEAVADPRERLRALFSMVAHEYKAHIIYSELLKALDHPAVQPVIGRVSERRLEYLTASFRQAGLGRDDARNRARLAYAAYVGFLQLNLQLKQTRLQHDEFEAYVDHMMETLIPPPGPAS
ncbi:MAG TPA: TetR/AcrR family transcriptional regulator [Lysobacter sp.]|nr:TetR/AcrR family transcriptional regulator [Lysobacter sp.]